MIGKSIFDGIRSKLFGSKDYFERVKTRLIRSLIIPLFIVIGTPTILIAVLSNVRYLEVKTHGSVIKFLGAASSEFLLLAVTVLITFFAALGCNLYYSLHNTRVMKELREIEQLEERQEAYMRLVSKLNGYISAQENDKALQLGSFIVNRYKPEIERNSEVIFSLLDLPNSEALVLDIEQKNHISHQEIN